MPFDELRNRRNSYAYPAVALQGTYLGPVAVNFGSTMAMDDYIHGLLLSKKPEKKVLGYLSVLFWGFYSGQDGVVRQERALGKVALACNGKHRMVNGQNQHIRGVVDLGVECVAGRISEAIQRIETNNFSEALRILNELPQLQIAFSSKVCAFIDPIKCGVIDSVIVENHPEFNFTTDRGGIILNRVANRQRYSDYCLYLQHTTDEINNSQAPYLWTDRDGVSHSWRALDVERAMY